LPENEIKQMILLLWLTLALVAAIACIITFITITNWLSNNKKVKSRLVKLKLIVVLMKLKLLKPGDLFWDV
jgi:hypothetical protein